MNRAGQLVKQNVFAEGCENIEQDDFFIEHGRAMPAAGRKMENISSLRDSFHFFDYEKHTAALNQRELLMRVLMRRSDNMRGKAQPANHHLLADNYLPLDPIAKVLHRHHTPLVVLR